MVKRWRLQRGDMIETFAGAKGALVADADYDALAAEVATLRAENERLHTEMDKARLAEAERLLREWQATADVAQDMTFVPVARRTYSFFHTADQPTPVHCPDCTDEDCADGCAYADDDGSAG